MFEKSADSARLGFLKFQTNTGFIHEFTRIFANSKSIRGLFSDFEITGLVGKRARNTMRVANVVRNHSLLAPEILFQRIERLKTPKLCLKEPETLPATLKERRA
jgi:hypothetical protein